MKIIKYLPTISIIMIIIGFVAICISICNIPYQNDRLFILIVLIWMIFWALIYELKIWIERGRQK